MQYALQTGQAELAGYAQASRMGAMTASIAHEVNQPLAAIVANANAALRWMARTPPDVAGKVLSRLFVRANAPLR
ncbi:MAG: hypothetical protein WBW11_11180 [Pseudolabrys sp.]